MSNLVIVESPAKAKTLEKFLGRDFTVVSSIGHIADLPKKELGIDTETYLPKYVIPEDKKKVVTKLKKLVKENETIWLASDEDREGEAIAWHIFNNLNLKESNTKRIVFNSITKQAVLSAIEKPRKIDINLVNAQQARRVIDRLVGYELSPILWKKIKMGLSAGRVQSVTTRLIVEREREIEDYTAKKSYKITGEFKTKRNEVLKAILEKSFETEEETQVFIDKNKRAIYHISNIETKPGKKQPSAPYITSTLQQDASIKLGFNVNRTMQTAQRLYEKGLITYMRTDSKNLSRDAIQQAKELILEKYGEKYSKPRSFGKVKGAQEAHEAIRPTNLKIETIKEDYAQERLYRLIWQRTVASQMSEVSVRKTVAKISTEVSNLNFITKSEIIVFDGFLKIYLENNKNNLNEEGILTDLEEGEGISRDYIIATETFSKPSARYTEASLVKKLEEQGIGRPSTYAPIISTIQNREYVEIGDNEGVQREYKIYTLKGEIITQNILVEKHNGNKGKLIPTNIGKIVNDFLVDNFKDILDYQFTAKIERSFDEIATGNIKWLDVLKTFYSDFHPRVKDVEVNVERFSGERVLGIDPKSNKRIVVRLGRFGPIAQIGDSNDDDVRYTSLLKGQSIDRVTFEDVIKLFELPRQLGNYKTDSIESNIGRFGPYLKYQNTFISIPTDEDVYSITKEKAIEIILQKQEIDKPIYIYKEKNVQKGVGRFGPYIKWNNLFINVGKKYDFDNLSKEEIEFLIEEKLKKETEKIIKEWKTEKVRIEKARWGRFNIIYGAKKVQVGKETDVATFTLEKAKSYFSKTKKKSK